MSLGGGGSPPLVLGLPPASPPSSRSASNPTSPCHHDEPKKKRFHPFKAMRRMFRRKKYSREDSDEGRKSRSTSELLNVDNEKTGSTSDRDGTAPYTRRLSMSHDSIFTADNVSQDPKPIHGSSLSIQGIAMRGFKDELFSRIHSRRDSDEDMGLPHSPSSYPNTAEVIAQGLKSKSGKSHSAWSNGSLASVGSSENDEDSMFSHLSSHHSSHASLLDRRVFTPDGDIDVTIPIPLSHEAAHHKIAVRPKKTRAAGRNRRTQHVSAASSNLPTTLEVEEISSSSLSSLSSELKQTPVHEATGHQQTVINATQQITEMSIQATLEADVPNSDAELHSNVATSSPSPPISRSKSTAAELKLQHEINQFSRRMAEKSTKHDSPTDHETSDSILNRQFHGVETALVAKEKKNSTTEEVLRASWLVAFKDNSNPKVDDVSKPDESSKQLKAVKPGSKQKALTATTVDAESSESTPSKCTEEPFLSRLFNSRRSNRRVKKKDEDEKLCHGVEQEINLPTSKYSSKALRSLSLQSGSTNMPEEGKSKVPKPFRHSFELQNYEKEPGPCLKPTESGKSLPIPSNYSEEDGKSAQQDVKLKPVQRKDSKGAKIEHSDPQENEFMRNFRKISENNEKRTNLLRPVSGEIIYQSNPNKGIEITSVSNAIKSSADMENNATYSEHENSESANSQIVQFRILPAENKDPSSRTGNDSSILPKGNSSVMDTRAHSKRSLEGSDPFKEDTEKWDVRIKQKSVDSTETKLDNAKVTEVVDNNANVTKVSISKHTSCDKDIKGSTKLPLRESQSDVSVEKSVCDSSVTKLKSGKSSRRNSFEVNYEKAKSENSTESELFKIFAKLSQKQSIDNDKENVEGKSLVIYDKETPSDNSKTKDYTRTVTDDNSVCDHQTDSNRPRSHTFPDSILPVIEIAKDKSSELVKRSNSDKKTLKKQDSVSSNTDSSSELTPPWLVLAQQRREQREKREKNIFGEQPSSFIIENATSAKASSRSSKVMDMVSSFQKLQVT